MQPLPYVTSPVLDGSGYVLSYPQSNTCSMSYLSLLSKMLEEKRYGRGRQERGRTEVTEQRGHFLVDHQGRKTLEVHCLRPGHQVPVSHLRCVVSTSTSAQSSSGWGTRSIDGRTLERVLLQRVLGAARHVGGRSKRAHGEACDEAMRAPFALRSIVVLIQSPPSSHLLLLHDHTTLWTRVANRHLVYRVCLWCSHHACSTCFRGCGRIAVGVGSVQARGRLVSAGTRQSMLRVLALARVHC